MLSHEELRRLAQIQRGLEQDDPAFVRRLQRMRAPRRPHPWSAALLVLGVVGVLAGIVLRDLTTLAVLGGLPLMFWALQWVGRPRN